MAGRKQAILVMVHGGFEQLSILLSCLDCAEFDIFLHVDARIRDVPWGMLESSVTLSRLEMAKQRFKVAWGGESMIRCELALLAQAQDNGPYSFYHLISGQDMPLRPAKDIWSFFNSHPNREFVAIQYVASDPRYPNEVVRRYSVWHPFAEMPKRGNGLPRLIFFLDRACSRLQQHCGVTRHVSLAHAKGAQWFSITDAFARWLLQRRDEVEREFRSTVFCDEVFLQSMLLRSPFWKRRWQDSEEHRQCMRLVDWERGSPYTFTIDDLDELLSSDMMFARKFDMAIDGEVVMRLKRKAWPLS